MTLDVLVLNSGEWVLADELPAAPWHVLIYRQRGRPLNELHLWLPRRDAQRSGDFAFRRVWVDESIRWCVEVPADPDPRAARGAPGSRADGRVRVRFTSPDGKAFWAAHHGAKGLGDLSDYDLSCLLDAAREGPYFGR